jgi:hypothetical protein
VSKSEEDAYAIVFTKPEDFIVGGPSDGEDTNEITLHASIHIPPEEAKELGRPNCCRVHALIVCRLTEPFSEQDEQHQTPTLDAPFDMLTHHHFVVAKVKEVWLFGARSGVVYAKIRHKG